jgi:hypothetical protein
MIEIQNDGAACAGENSAPIAASITGPGCNVDDPLVDAIELLRKKMADYNANAPDDDDGAADYAAGGVSLALTAIRVWCDPARTRQGAMRALRLARDAVEDGDHEIAGAMNGAALAYFEEA